MSTAWTNRFISIPYLKKGRDFDGLDCWGLVQAIYAIELNIILPGYLEQYNDTNRRDVPEAINRNLHDWRAVTNGEQEMFDVVVLNVRGLPMHVGVLVDPNSSTFIHVAPGQTVTIERLTSPKWYNRILGFMRLKMIEEASER